MTETVKPKINIGDLALDHWQQGTLYEGRDVSFGALLGLNDLGISYNQVPPGKSGCPFHNHHVEEELFFIISGEGEYRFGSTRTTVKAGDVLGAPAGGPETAHQLINTGAVPLLYLAMSTMAKTEICEYPDSGKFMAKTRVAGEPKAGFRYVGRSGEAVDYWDGEPGA